MGTDKQWKERGTGDFKVNSKKAENKTTARFLMRVDGSHRVVLNSPIKKDLLVEDPQRGPPRGRTAVFLGFVEDQIVTLQLKVCEGLILSFLEYLLTCLCFCRCAIMFRRLPFMMQSKGSRSSCDEDVNHRDTYPALSATHEIIKHLFYLGGARFSSSLTSNVQVQRIFGTGSRYHRMTRL